VQEFTKAPRSYRTEAGRQIGHHMARHAAGKPVVEGVGKTAPHPSLAAPIPGPDGHVVALIQLLHQPGHIGGVVLPVAVHEHQDVSRCRASTPLDRGAIAHRVWRREALDLVTRADIPGPVGGTVVYHDDFSGGLGGTQARQ
jgi:hypothetical protein